MKRLKKGAHIIIKAPAAFGRLCVETSDSAKAAVDSFPAAFGRLCVETLGDAHIYENAVQPPSGGCVLKPYKGQTYQ